MKISFITAAYNAANTIRRTVKSVAESNPRSSDIEHIVVNDGSTDATAAVLAGLQIDHEHLICIDQTNQGRSAARNAGLDVAKGDYVVFLDADDQIEKHFLSTMVGAAWLSPTSVIYSDWTETDQDGSAVVRGANIAEGVFAETSRRCPFVLHSCLVPTKLARAVDGFDPALSFAEDWDFWQRVARTGATFTRTPHVLVTYDRQVRLPRPETEHKNYRSAIGVIERAHSDDIRVLAPTAKLRHGLDSGSPLAGQGQTWVWFAGMEARSDLRYDWLDEELVALKPSLVNLPTPETLANAFVHGMWMARPPKLPAATDVTGRLTQLADHLGIEDASPLALRLLTPDHKPSELGDQIHLDLGFRSQQIRPQTTTGRIRIYSGRKNLPIPRAIYHVGQTDGITFHMGRGLARATLVTLKSRDVWRASSRMPLALRRNPGLARSLTRRFVETAVDQSVDKNFEPCSQEVSVRPAEAKSDFEEIFSVEDPWHYDEPYEVRKYQETLELLEAIVDLETKKVAEIGCAEGHFTLQIAPLVESLTAVDISSTAIRRTERKLAAAGIENTQTDTFDVRYDSLPQQQDLIICSELLYYMNRTELTRSIDRQVDSLQHEGYIVHAHAYEAAEREGKPGFGWRQDFGAATISAAFNAHENLRLEARIETDLYLVERFRKTRKATKAKLEFRPIERENLEPSIERQVLWAGYQARPRDKQTVTWQLPVLCYHSIGTGAPELLQRYQTSIEDLCTQLEWFRYQGYRSASIEEILGLVVLGKPIPGKAIHLTFDDGYKDFDSDAWPALQAYGFAATLFMPTFHIGQASTWDSKYGEVMPLLDRDRLEHLVAQGLTLGSHFTRHTPLTTLNTEEVYEGMRRSKVILERIAGEPVHEIAYPYGDSDIEIQRLAGACGYRLGYTTNDGSIQPLDRALGLDRIIVDATKDPVGQFENLPQPDNIGMACRLFQSSKQKAQTKIRRVLKTWPT